MSGYAAGTEELADSHASGRATAAEAEPDEDAEDRGNDEEQLKELVQRLAGDFGDLFKIDTHKEEADLNATIDGMMELMETYCTTLSAIKQANGVFMEEMLTNVVGEASHLPTVYSHIDRLEALVTTVRANLTDLDAEVSRAEELLASSSSVKRLFRNTLTSLSNFQFPFRSTASTSTLSSVSHSLSRSATSLTSNNSNADTSTGSGGGGGSSSSRPQSAIEKVLQRKESPSSSSTRSKSPVIRPHSSDLCPYEPIPIFSSDYFFHDTDRENLMCNSNHSPQIDPNNPRSVPSTVIQIARETNNLPSEGVAHSEDVSHEELNV